MDFTGTDFILKMEVNKVYFSKLHPGRLHGFARSAQNYSAEKAVFNFIFLGRLIIVQLRNRLG